MAYICDYGHKHRTTTAVEYCHVNVPWREKEALLKTTPWQHEGTTEVWSDLGRFRDLFWSLTRYYIIERDRCCQYEKCGRLECYMKHRQHHNLEVHHIIPRRLGGTDHPANLITLCHEHHRIQPAHHHDVGLVVCDADIPVTSSIPQRFRQPRPECETTLAAFGF